MAAGRGSTVVDMEISQIQLEAINASHNEGPIDAGAFAKILNLDTGAAVEAFTDLEERGLMHQGDDGRFSLTSDGAAFHRRREAQASAAVKRATPTWQPR
jgi:Mn-dependent DtxR family transcriptional regulator